MKGLPVWLIILSSSFSSKKKTEYKKGSQINIDVFSVDIYAEIIVTNKTTRKKAMQNKTQ